MKSIFRITLLVALLALGLSAAIVPTRAASPCEALGLSSDDCALIDAVNASKNNVFTIDSWSVKVNVSGTPGGDVTADISGTGAVDASAVKADPAKTDSFYTGLKLQLAGSGTVNASGKEQKGDFEIRIVDNTLFAKLNGQWFKGDMKSLADSQSSSLGSLGSMGSMGSSGLDFASLAALPGLLKAEAKDGPAIGEQKTRQVTLTVDLGAVVNPANLDAVKKALGPAGAQADMLLAGFGSILQNVKITLVGYYGVDSKHFHGLDLSINATIAKEAAAMLGSALANDVKADISFSTRLTKFDEAVTVEAVPDAKPLPTGSK